MITLYDLEVTMAALESWVDAFEDDEPDRAQIVKNVITAMESVAAEMRTAPKVLRLVSPTKRFEAVEEIAGWVIYDNSNNQIVSCFGSDKAAAIEREKELNEV